MEIVRIINEARDVCNKLSDKLLLPQYRDQPFGEKIHSCNDIWIKNYCMNFICDITLNASAYEYIYQHLGDADSKKTFEEIVIKRFLYILSSESRYEYSHYPIQLEYDRIIEKVEKQLLVTSKYSNKYEKSDLFHWNGYEILSETKNIAAFLLNQYSYKDIIHVQETDCVLDCGASQGEEVFYFRSIADAVQLHSFALDEDEIEAYKANMKRNNIAGYYINRLAVWNRSSVNLTFIPEGSRSTISRYGNKPVNSITLDEYVMRQRLVGPFFIKMDVEGCEENALEGAAAIMDLPSTRAAVSVYHRPEDIRIIGGYLLKRRDVIYLKQCKSNLSETMMYC